MSIDEAIAQLEFNDKKGAKIMKEVRSSWPAVLQSSILAKLQMCVMILSVCICLFSGSPGSSGHGS